MHIPSLFFDQLHQWIQLILLLASLPVTKIMNIFSKDCTNPFKMEHYKQDQFNTMKQYIPLQGCPHILSHHGNLLRPGYMEKTQPHIYLSSHTHTKNMLNDLSYSKTFIKLK